MNQCNEPAGRASLEREREFYEDLYSGFALGAGSGDTGVPLAPHMGSIVGIDISPRGVGHSKRTADVLAMRNASFLPADNFEAVP